MIFTNYFCKFDELKNKVRIPTKRILSLCDINQALIQHSDDFVISGI